MHLKFFQLIASWDTLNAIFNASRNELCPNLNKYGDKSFRLTTEVLSYTKTRHPAVKQACPKWYWKEGGALSHV